VGAVVVRDGAVVGQGATEAPGGRHAEIVALEAAGPQARGATLTVTLEPCGHQGRTPPCTRAILDAGVERVVVGVLDPDERVAGRGLDELRAAGLAVDAGVGADAVRRSLAPYLHHRSTGRAYCVAKTALGLDATTAAADGTSHWLTGDAARADVHELRADSQAVVVGSGTALADRPSLTVRGVTQAPRELPWRVLLDGRGRVPATGPLFDDGLGPVLVVTTQAAPAAAVDAWRAAGAKVETVNPGPDGRGVDLGATLDLLGRHQVLQALFEGGATVHGALLAAGLVDRLVAYVAPVVLGERARGAFPGPGPDTLDAATRWRLDDVRRLGDDVRLDYTPLVPGR
jgi:diaminohydroxyphosphoribosylaminopyrimidine deaminase/5-amino-6-(5-phosphoribosylamino)uracil reductase